MEKINTMFELLEEWWKYPGYQLERRLDIFFAIYLEKILKKLKNIDIKTKENIFAEFPIRKFEGNEKDYSSYNADYAVFYKNEANQFNLCLVELKTDMNSIKKKSQIEYYKNVKERNIKQIIEEGVIAIYGKSKSWIKYEVILKKLEKMNLLTENNKKRCKKLEWNIEKESFVDDKIKTDVVYIIPNKSHKDAKLLDDFKNNIIDFKDITTILQSEKDIFSQKFCELLTKIYESYE